MVYESDDSLEVLELQILKLDLDESVAAYFIYLLQFANPLSMILKACEFFFSENSV